MFAAKGVNEALWIATLRSEDASLDPAIKTYDPDAAGNPGYSYGLFQLRQPGLGSASSVDILTDAEGNSNIASSVMGKHLNLAGAYNASLPDQMRVIEDAGWPGKGHGQAVDNARQQALRDTVTEMGAKGAAAGIPASNAANDPKKVSKENNNSSDWKVALGKLGNEIFLGSIIIAVIGGGFALVAAGARSEV